MRDQPEAWSDRQEPVMEGVPAQRAPAEGQSAGTGPDGAWAPPAERVADPPGAWMPAGAPGQAVAAGEPHRDHGDADSAGAADDRAAADEDRAVGVASVPGEGAASRGDGAARDGDAQAWAAGDDEVRNDAALHDSAYELRDEEHARRVVDNGDDDGGAVYRGEADTDREADMDRAAEDRAAEDAERADKAEDAERADKAQDAEPADEAQRAEHAEAWADKPLAGGAPDDAVFRQDAPVPAAAYDTAEPGTADPGTAEPGMAEPGTAEPADFAAAGAEAGDATAPTQATELMPGDVPEESPAALFERGTAEGFRDRWQRVQMQFVDDPRDAADQARALVDDVFTALRDALTNQRDALDSWQSGQSGQSGDTEQLRVAVRRYRDFLDRMLGL